METLLGIGLIALLLICPLMMIGMIVGGWIFGRKAMGHGGHGMMMCHGGHAEPSGPETSLEAMTVERERLDRAIGDAERRERGAEHASRTR